MKSRILLISLFVVAMVGTAWFGWSWYSMPTLPNIPMTGMRPGLAAEIEKSLREVRRRPRDAKSWGDLGQLLIAHNLNEQALPCLAQARRLAPNDARWPYLQASISMLLIKTEEVVPALRQALALTHDPEEKAAIYALLAQALLEEDKFDESAECARELRAIDGDSPRVRYCLGLLAKKREDWAAAREHLTTLVDHPCARRQACSLLAGLPTSNAATAEGYRRRAAQLPPDVPWRNSFDDGVRNFRIEDGNPVDRYHELVAAGRQQEALAHLREVATHSPDEQTSLLLGQILARNGEFDEAEMTLRQAVAINPRHVKANLLLAGVLFEKGSRLYEQPNDKARGQTLLEQAISTADRVLAAQSDQALAHMVRGNSLSMLGRDTEAREALRLAVLTNPNLVDAHLVLGEKLAETGRLQEGLVHLEDAVRLASSTDERPRKALQKWRAKLKPPS